MRIRKRSRISTERSELRVLQDRACGSLSIHKGYSEPLKAWIEETPAAGPPWHADAEQEGAPSARVDAWVSGNTPQGSADSIGSDGI